MKRRADYLFSVMALAVLTTPVLAANTFEFTGTAESDGATLYKEHHELQGVCENGVFQPAKHRVAYRRPDEQKSFAQKRLDYGQSAIRPAMDYRQPDFQERLEVTYPNTDSVAIKWQQPDGGIKQSSVKTTDNLVVDAGFDNLVRQHWDNIISDNPINFRFLAPTRGTNYAFVLEPEDDPKLAADHVVQIRPDSMVLNFLMDPIILGYNDKGALTLYSGLTNVRKNTDQNYTATIRYEVSSYPDCQLIP